MTSTTFLSLAVVDIHQVLDHVREVNGGALVGDDHLAPATRGSLSMNRAHTPLRYGDAYLLHPPQIYSGPVGQSKPAQPLTPAVFHILLALYGRERHGYDIMQQVKEDSRGRVKMGPGTLYGSLDRMMAAGLVSESNKQDPRRIYYKLTALGQAALRAESERLSAVAALARRQLGAT
jgi:DNA-binding MarR family transcriptional regulator